MDEITGLPGRRVFMERLAKVARRPAVGSHCGSALLFIDLDRFKRVNKSFGHVTGNKLLACAAQRILSTVRAADVVTRRSGDEFLVLLDDVGAPRRAAGMSRRILHELSLPFSVDGVTFHISASIGVVAGVEGFANEIETLRSAEIAMYRAKDRGGNNFKIYSPALHRHELESFALEADLRLALERDALELVYQPIVELGDGRPVGYEALLRWTHPELGPVSPVRFVPVAEATGLIVPVGDWVLGAACRQIVGWQESVLDDGRYVSVNISARQLTHAHFLEGFVRTVERYGVDPQRLRVEITESVLMEDAVKARARLLKLKDMGVRILMDDFGTGYSSLSYLLSFPFDVIKIDRSFIRDLGTGSGGSRLVESIMHLAESIGLSTVAEGVETPAQRRRLMELGCGYGQGYLFSRPLAPAMVEAAAAEAGPARSAAG
ncbi:MAG: putative bifunctional diguanylate cyclase/phosphodiesterase [Desulfovibrionaceae bacterium]